MTDRRQCFHLSIEYQSAVQTDTSLLLLLLEEAWCDLRRVRRGQRLGSQVCARMKAKWPV